MTHYPKKPRVRPKLFAYLLDPGEDEMLVGVVIDASGKEHGRADGHTESEVQATLRNGSGFDLWVPDPGSNPQVIAAWARGSRRASSDEPETARIDPAPRVPQPEAPSALRARRAEQHLCHYCEHSAMCEMANTVRRLEALSPVVTGCLGFEPPPATNVHDLGDDLATLTREGV